MGTRGAYGFIKNGVEKITYNHFDSYPEWLGSNVVEFIQETGIRKLNEIFDSICMVNKKDVPTKKQIEECEEFKDLDVGSQSESDWYCLLRGAQGNLSAYSSGLKYMIDSSEFMFDSLFCEFAYIINLDTEMLEFYKGFNTDESARGRYASVKGRDSQGYYGVALVTEFPLKSIVECGLDWTLVYPDEDGE